VIAMQGNPCIGLVDGSPTSPSQLGEVQGGNHISVVLVATSNATKEGLCSAISLVDSSASRTSLRSVFGFDVNNRNAFLQTLVFNHLLKSVKSPAMERCSLFLAMLTPLSYPVKLLHNNHSSFLQAVNKSPADLMQYCICPTMLPPAKPFEPSLCREGAFSLEGASKLSEVLPPILNWFTINTKAIGSYQELVDPDINTNGIIPSGFSNFDKNCDVQIKFLAIPSINQLGISHRILQKLSLIISDSKLNFDPPVNRGYGSSKFSTPEKSKESFIQIHRKLSELVLLLSVSLVRLGNSIPCSYRKIRRQIKSLFSFVINKAVQCNRVVNSVIPSYLAYVVASISKGFTSIHKLLEFIFGAIKLAYYCLGSFHQFIYTFEVFKTSAFLSMLSHGVSSGVVR